MVLIPVNSRLRRHRRRVLTALAVLAVALAALMAHTALMSNGMDDQAMSDAAVVCLAVGGSLAVVGVAALAVRRLSQRPLWVVPEPLVPAVRLVPASTGFLVRAGPPPLSQVFRL